MSLPTYIYKLIPSNAAPPEPLAEELPLSDLDQRSGFIHLSTASQVPGTLKHFFAEEEKVYILKIPFQPLEKKIKWESPDKSVCGERPSEGLFPHLYNGKLGREEVERVMTLEKGAGWDAAIEQAKSSWLV